MSTRSRIGILNDDTSITSVYVHWDGLPVYRAPILAHHYNTTEKVKALLKLGDLSVLGKHIGKAQNFEHRNKEEDWCLAYGRDRGEAGTQARKHGSTATFQRALDSCDAVWAYLFLPNHPGGAIWVVAKNPGRAAGFDWQPVATTPEVVAA